MKKLFISLSLVTILGTASAQTKSADKPAKPFQYTSDEQQTNRIYVLISQIRAIVPKSKVPSDEGEAMKANADSVILDIQKQYNTWIASQKKDSASGKK